MCLGFGNRKIGDRIQTIPCKEICKAFSGPQSRGSLVEDVYFFKLVFFWSPYCQGGGVEFKESATSQHSMTRNPVLIVALHPIDPQTVALTSKPPFDGVLGQSPC